MNFIQVGTFRPNAFGLYDVIGNADAPGYVRMKGAEPIFPTNAEIAQALGLSTDQVRRAVSRAYAVFRVWLTDPEEDETA